MSHWRLAILCLFAGVIGLSGSAWGQSGRPPNNTGRDYAVCHIEWVGTSTEGGGIVLLDPTEKLAVADSDTCLGCHDGSVADSRRAVWLEHGHRSGVVPAAGMKVPKELPLDGGKLACRTCHTAHVAGFKESLKNAVFLRVRNEQDQLCKTCHADKTRDPETGSHPLTKLKAVLPAALAAAGTHAGPKNDLILCQSCHTAHGAKSDRLLLMPTDASQLCISCHDTMRPAMWDTNPAHDHPQNPPIHKPAQLKAIKDMHTQLGAGDRLVCLSCHKMHEGHAGKAMLADTLHDSALCIRCHDERKAMAGTTHDLRKSASKELNARSETAEQSGPCGACHTFHSHTRKPAPGSGDPQGLCVTCHSRGQVASTHGTKLFHPVDLPRRGIPPKAVLPLSPSGKGPEMTTMTCLSCHDPHETKHPRFLRVSNEQICSDCHAPITDSLAKPHDFTGKKDVKNAVGASPAEAGRCGFCHSVHEARGPIMLAATTRPVKTMDDACIQCHQPEGMREHPVAKYNHPSGPDVKLKEIAANLSAPLFNSRLQRDSAGSVACSSCHDVHLGGKKSKTLLRSASAADLCTQCHASQGRMAAGPHDAGTATKPFPAEAASSKDLCLACGDLRQVSCRGRSYRDVQPQPG